MKIPLLASLFLFLWVFCRQLKRHTRSLQEEQQAFWQKEREANNVRKKSLENLDYIAVPLERLPITLHTDNETIADCVATITILSKCKIVNLTGITNTDLKLTYGTANITVLTEYDQNFTLLVTTLQKWADALLSLGDMIAARMVLEYAVEVKSDVTKTYLLLAELYAGQPETAMLSALLASAQKLTSPSGKMIVRRLKEQYPDL